MSPDVIVPAGTSAETRPKAAKQAPPLKILVVTTSLEPGRRFPAPVAFANALAEQGVSVMFAAEAGPLRAGLSSAVHYVPIDSAEGAPVKTAHELSALIRHHQPDVVHSHGARCAVVTALAVKACRVPCARVMTQYSPGFTRFPRWIKKPLLRNVADRFFAANEAMAGELASLGIAEERIRIESIEDRHAAGFARASIGVYRQLVTK